MSRIEHRATTASRPSSYDQSVPKLGGAAAIIGGLGYLATLLAHGDLPDNTTRVALEHIASRPEWRLLKLALIASLMCWLGAFLALATTLPEGLSAWLGRWAAGVAVAGTAIVVVEYAIIGHALGAVADQWSVDPAPEHLQRADLMLAISGGLFHSFVAWMLGLPFVLAGVAVALSNRYPRWLGWAATTAGAGALLAGTTRFLGIDLVPYPLLYGGFVLPLNLWLVAIGVLMWRRTAVFTPRPDHGDVAVGHRSQPAQTATVRAPTSER